MANNNLVARLDNENIVIVDEINDHAVGENSGIFDETTDTLYPFGGGGESLHKITITAKNESSYEIYNIVKWPPINDNNALYGLGDLAVGSTITASYLYFNLDSDYRAELDTTQVAVKSYSNAVNCTIIDGNLISITDPTQDASINLVLEDVGGES